MKKQRLINAIRFIEDNYAQICSPEEIALGIKCNYHSLRHDFAFHVGQTLCQYINKTRCERAAALLQQTDWKIYKIAQEVGFRDDKYFIRVFERNMGMSPTDFRKS
jgi:two-component system response regulator YesN